MERRTRTCNLWSHNPVLYQLSYYHHKLLYNIVLKMVLNFFRWIVAETGPNTYFDRKSCFFLIIRALLILNRKTEPSSLFVGHLVLIIIARQMSPFLLNLNLNPLYSIRGGSTTRADPFTKKPKLVRRRSKPLYKWKTWNHRIFVLSAILNQVCFKIIRALSFLFLIKPVYP